MRWLHSSGKNIFFAPCTYDSGNIFFFDCAVVGTDSSLAAKKTYNFYAYP